MSSLGNTLAPINDEVNSDKTQDAMSSHKLIEIQCHSRVKKIPGSHKVLEMVPLEQSK